MTLQEYFGDWLKVFDYKEFNSILTQLNTLYRTRLICPKKENVFRAFNLCPYNNCRCIFIGYDPYNDIYEGEPRATGILFGNNKNISEDKYSPSLKIVKNASIDLCIPHNCITFDPTLESWARQGILMINSALTVEAWKPGSHLMLWRKFISTMLSNISQIETGMVYVLFGSEAKTFKPYIGKNNTILEENHPAYYARMHKEMPPGLFREINTILKRIYNYQIKWFNYENNEEKAHYY